MGKQCFRAARVPNPALCRHTARATRSAAVCLAALAAAACGGRAHDEAIDVAPGKSELLLLDGLGRPVAQTRALVDGKVVTTNDEGRAELGELPARYDVVIAVGTTVRAFMGLQARSPTIEIANRQLDFSNEHQARVNISSATTVSNQSVFYAAGVTGADISRQTMGYNGDGKSSWAIIGWAGAGDVTLSAQAMLAEMDPKTQSVLRYSGFASQTWPNAAQQGTVDWTPAFEAPPFETKTIHVDLSLPLDMSIRWYSVNLRRASGEMGPIGVFYSGARADLLVPDLPGATFDIFASLDGPGGSYQVVMRAVSAGATVHAEGAGGLRQLAPQDGMENVTPETNFGWSTQPGVVYELLAFSDSDTQPWYDYLVATSASTAQLPDASALGIPFPAGVTLQWLARSERGFDSLDDYAAAPDAATGTGFSDYRTITTAP
jgi:hypothetical protein